jgi:hypothetical protein
VATLKVDSVRQTVSEQIEPIVRLFHELAGRWILGVDLERARARLKCGRVAYDPLEVIGSAGGLLVPFVRATVALERAGLASDEEAIMARERRFQIAVLIAAWLANEPMPRDRVRGVARRAATLVGSSILHRASADLLAGLSLDHWKKGHCPCCGGAAEFSRWENSRRTLTCGRCDAHWTCDRVGCVGCGATEAPAIARVTSPALGYQLTICNSCGRYIKEPLLPDELDPLVDRALTVHLDLAAEKRGLRL